MVSNKIYQATPEYGPDDKGGPILVVDKEAESTVELNPRLDLINHSPTGFGWGYLGSGPAQTALAILADAVDNDKFALSNYQLFKEMVIAHKTGTWSMSQREVRSWVTMFARPRMVWHEQA